MPANMLQQTYREKIFISEDHASRSWVLAIAAGISLTPLLGSAFTPFAVLIGFLGFLQYLYGPHGRTLHLEERLAAWLVGIYLAIALVAVLIARDPIVGLWLWASNIGLVFLAPLLFAVHRCAGPGWQRDVTLWVAAGSLLILPALMVEWVWMPDARAELLTGNPLILAQLAGVSAVLLSCGALWLPDLTPFQRWLCGAGAVSAGIAVLFSAGRMAIASLALILTVNLAGWLWSKRGAGFLRYAALAVGLAALIAVSGVLVLQQSNVGHRFVRFFESVAAYNKNNGEMEVSASNRLAMYKGGFKAALQAPLTGYGRHHVMSAAGKHAQQEKAHTFGYTHLHNAWLTEFVASGLIGLVAYSCLAFLPLWLVRKKPPPMLWAGASATGFIWLQQTVNIGFYHDLTVLSFVFLCAFIYGQPIHGEPARS